MKWRRRRRHDPPSRYSPDSTSIDATGYLSVVLVLQLCIPSSLQLTALGSAGSPSVVLGLPAVVWWTWSQIRRHPFHNGRSSVRAAVIAWATTMLVAYVGVMSRALPADEATPADNGLLRTIAWTGIALLACDGVRRDGLRILFDRLVWVASAIAVLGLLQFVTGQDLVGSISIPGFSQTQSFDAVQDRAGFARAAGTAAHPLEFAVVVCGAIPFALARALRRDTQIHLRWVPPLLLVSIGALSVSRSTLIGLAVAVLLMLPAMTRPQRIMTLLGGVLGGVAVFLAVPGMAGTILRLFGGAADDEGVQSRVDSYALVLDMFTNSPLIGRGFGTFLPQYRILDNQYLLTLIETGIVGVAGLGFLIFTSIRCVLVRISAFDLDPSDRLLAHAIVASLGATTVLMAFFDAFSFPMAPTMLFFTVGAAGAFTHATDGLGSDPIHVEG